MENESCTAVMARRAAHVLVQHLGGASVQLQLPAPPIAGDDGEQLGLRTPEFQMRVVVPVAVRKLAKTVEVLVPADTLEALLGVEGSGAVRAAVMAASAVQIAEELFVLTGCEDMIAGSRPCLYRLLAESVGTEVE